MVDFTRLTLAHGTARVDVVVASDQPLSAMVPRFCDLLGLRPGTGMYGLVRPIGDSLDLSGNCRDNQLADGEIIYLEHWTDAPASPVVTDVTDAVAADRSARTNTWESPIKRHASAVATGVTCLAGGMLIPWDSLRDLEQMWILLAAVILLSACAVFAGRILSTRVGTIVGAAAMGLCVPGGLSLARVLAVDHIQASLLASLMLFWCVSAVVVGIGSRHWTALVGGTVCAAISGLGLGLAAAGVATASVWGVVGVVSAVVMGLTPAWAISVSGLTGLDDALTAGGQAERDRLKVSLGDAYDMVAWCASGCAVGAGLSAVMLATQPDRWATALTFVLLTIVVLRARLLPHVVPAIISWCAVLCAAAMLLLGLSSWWRLGGFLLLAVVAGLAGGVPLPDHVRVRLRGWANMVEKLAAITALPILLGLFGVYGQLLGTYS